MMSITIRNSLLWDASATYLGVVSLIAALAKFFRRNGSNGSFTRLRETALGLTLLFTAIPLIYFRSAYILVISGSVVTFVAIVGEVLRLKGGSHGNCNCFGSLTPSNRFIMPIVTLLSILACANLFVNFAAHLHLHRGLYLLVISMVIVLIALIKIVHNIYTQSFDTVSGRELKSCDDKERDGFSEGFILGERLGLPVTLEGIKLSTFSAVLIIGISTTCHACKQVYDYYASVSKNFPEDILVVFISKTKVRYMSESSGVLNVLDKRMNVAKFLCVPNTPFAVLLDNDYSFIANPSLGLDKVQNLLRLIPKLS